MRIDDHRLRPDLNRPPAVVHQQLLALASASLAWAKTASTVSASSSSPLTILRARASIRSSPKAASPSSGSSPSTARELCSFFATSFSASACRLFRYAIETTFTGLRCLMRHGRRDAWRIRYTL